MTKKLKKPLFPFSISEKEAFFANLVHFYNKETMLGFEWSPYYANLTHLTVLAYICKLYSSVLRFDRTFNFPGKIYQISALFIVQDLHVTPLNCGPISLYCAPLKSLPTLSLTYHPFPQQ